jgi:nucleoside-diphosphate-sugar epimerase
MILITGASGHVGTELARSLAARRVPFRAMVRAPETAQTLAGLPGVELVRGDFNPVAQPDSQLFIALMSGEHAMHDFANRDLRAKLAATSIRLSDDQKRQSAQVSGFSTASTSTDSSRRFPGPGAGG